MFTIKEIAEASGGILIQGQEDVRVKGVSIDSRTIKRGELFVAVKGERFDGHDYIAQALARGAPAVLFSQMCCVSGKREKSKSQSPAMVRVKDTLRALGALAHRHRMRFKIPIIAITGSNGKTTTKEMVSTLLRTRFSVLCNRGTENNHIGLPLTLLRLNQKHDLCVLELGANHPGEIDTLSWIAQPNMAIFTNIGPAHLEFFKTLQGVLKAKSELIDNLAPGSKIIVNKNNRFLFALVGQPFEIITFGLDQPADFSATLLAQTDKGTTFLLNGKQRIALRALGGHNICNALASIACARCFGISYAAIKKALAGFKALPMRMQILDVEGIKFIVDCYNSNPESLRCALDFLKDRLTEGKKIAVCGDMRELGDKSEKFHLQLGSKIARDKIDFLITMGRLAKGIISGACAAGMARKNTYYCRDSGEIARVLRDLAEPGDAVLIKGSRAMKMENILECFTGSFIR